MSNITIQQVESRIKEIVDTVTRYNKATSELNVEYQQLLGYKQALVDLTTVKEGGDVQEEGVQQLNENTKGA